MQRCKRAIAPSEGIEITLPSWQNVSHWTSVLDTMTNIVLIEQTHKASGAMTAPASSILAFAGKR